MDGTRFETRSVATKEQPAADHVDGANDHGGAGRIDPPFGVICKLTAKCADSEWLCGRDSAHLPQFVAEVGDAPRHEAFPDSLRLVGGLINDSPAIDDVDKTTGHGVRIPR
jgi:hypothetical protein